MINLFIDNNEQSNNYTKIIEVVEKKLEYKEIDRISILEALTKKLKKKEIKLQEILDKMNNENNNNNLKDMSAQRYTNWLLG